MPRVRREKRLPLSGIYLSVFRGCFRFTPSGDRGSLVLGALFPSFRVKSFWISFDRVEAFLAFVWYLLLFGAKGFWFRPFDRSKPLCICLALVVPFGAEDFLVRTFK